MSCQNKEISFLQGRSWKNCAESAEAEFPCKEAKSEVGYGCNGVQPIWREALSVSHSRSAQQGSGQLHNIRSSSAEYGDDYAGKATVWTML